MMTAGLHMVLLGFALVGFAGAGAALAVARSRYLNDGHRDAGMTGVALMLLVFGSLCTALGSGIAGVLAFGTLCAGIGYTTTAQRLGLFRIETGWLEEAPAEEPRQPT